MRVERITEELQRQTEMHTTARKVVELIEAAVSKIEAAGFDGDEARERILALVTEDE